MNKRFITTLLASIVGVCTFAAFADDDVPFGHQIEARQAFMHVYAFNLGLLGAMAKGDMPYDAELATNASNNLVAAANMKNGPMWPAGSDIDAPGLADATGAKAAIWANFPMVGEKHGALTEALTSMAAVAGTGLDAVRANIGEVGNSCKGCHEEFRVDRDH